MRRGQKKSPPPNALSRGLEEKNTTLETQISISPKLGQAVNALDELLAKLTDKEQDQALAWLLQRHRKRLEKMIGEGWDSILSMHLDKVVVAEEALSWKSPEKEKPHE